MNKNKLIFLSALSVPVAITGGVVAMDFININAVNEQNLSTKATISINNYRVENVTDEGFDFIIKFNSDEEITSVGLPFWKEGNYIGIKEHNNVQKIGINEFKAHIKMSEIGSGTDYIYIGIHPRTANNSYFIEDLCIKLDTINPNLNISQTTTNWTNKNITVKANSTDNMNIVKNFYFYKNSSQIKKENSFSNPKILSIVGYNNDSPVSNSLKGKYSNLTIINQSDITSIDILRGYDIVIYDGYAWGIEAQTANLLNQLFEEGASIITNLNDSYSNLAISSSGATHDTSGGLPKFSLYSNGFGYSQKGSINRATGLLNGSYDGDGNVYKLNKSEDSFTLLTGTYQDGTTAPVSVIKTHSNGNKWIHNQIGSATATSGAINRMIDEIMHGTMKTRQSYEKSFEISENGTYEVEVEDFSGNKTKKSITVSNIDKVAPTMTITGNPTSWVNQATLKVTGSDNLSGIKQIVLPNGNIVNGNTANYTVTANGNYTFKVIDNAGNEYSQTVNVSKVDGSVGDINKVKSTMAHLNEATSSRRITITFPSVSDTLSGIKGYSYVIDKNPTTNPDNVIDTTTNTITKDITDTGKYYLHIKAIDNVDNVGNIKHYEIEVPALVNKINSKGTLDLNWTMDTNDQPYIYSVLRKRGDESGYSALGNSTLRDRVNVLNIHPGVGNAITYTTWDGETITDVKSASLKQWMEEPNSENPKGYGMGIIEVIPITLDTFNLNPDTYLYKATSGVNKDKYVTNIRGYEEVIDVVMFGTWDANGSKDISDSGVTNIKAFLDDNGAVLFGHDTLHYSKNFWRFASYADVIKQNPVTSPETGTSMILGGSEVQANREGLITKYPWNIGMEELTVPSTHTSWQMVNDKNTWMRFSRPSDGIIPPSLQNAGWVEGLVQYDGYSNDAYLALNGNVGQIQTGHTSGSATPDEQKVLANTLFYISQLTTTTEKQMTDELAIDVDNPTNISLIDYEFLNNGSRINFNFTNSIDKGTEYSYYVKAEGQDDNAIRLSNTVKNTIISGLKGYSFIVDNNPNSVPDNVIDTTSSSITIDNNKGNTLYIHIKAIDNMGNVSETTHYQLSDTTAPTMTITGNPTSWTNKDVTLNINASDVGTGVKHIVLPNGTIVTGSTASYTVSANGNYTFKVVDKMGNETTQTVIVNKIDKSINNISNVFSNMEMIDVKTSKRKMIFTFNPVSESGQSGLKGYSYVIDKNPTTIPDSNIETTSTRIEKEITDTGVYYLHIKAIDNAGNVTGVVHHKVDIPNLTATVMSKENQIKLNWALNDYNNKTYKIFQKKEGSDSFQTIGATNFDTSKQVKVLNVYPAGVGDTLAPITPITFTTWDGETVTTDLSGSLKKWMEEPNSEHPKGYGQGIIEVTPVTFAEFNANPSKYLSKDSNGKWNYDVVFVGAYDCNGSCPIQGKFNSDTTKYVTTYVDDGYGFLLGHDFNTLKERLRSGESSGVGALASDLIKINKKGIMTSYPWNLGEVGDTLSIPYAHNNGDMVDGDVWFKYTENTNPEHCNKWCSIEVQTERSTNNHYLVTKNNLGMIQTGHSRGQATSDEQKILANTLFYLKQLSTDNFLNDKSGADVKAPDMPKFTNHKFTEDGYIELKFNEVVDNGSEYSYYVESQTRDKDSTTLSNVITDTITSGLKGYSFVIDSNPNTVPDNTIESTKAETIKLKTDNSRELYVHIKAIDNVGNSSETYHYRITDTTAPNINITKNPSSWTNGSVTLTATATDTGSGVKYMILPNGNKVSASSVSYTVDKNGIYFFRAIDYMGNEATVSVIVDNIDKKKPIVDIDNNQNWTNQDVKVTITSEDD